MITIEKIKIYGRYYGDIDGWIRIGTDLEKSIINDIDWSLIEEFIQEIHLVKNGLAAKSFSSALDEKLIKTCYDERAINMLKEISERLF